MSEAGVLELTCHVQKYHWGKRGPSSLVAQLALEGKHLASIDETTTYAELWMGTHPSCPSQVRGTDKTLASYITEHPECLGSSVRAVFGVHLPFLFKVLSVGAPLSIQAHPTKVMAKKLHEARPDLYPDSNHKPEIAIALTDFEAFCNFRPLQEITNLLKGLPELQQVLGPLAEQPLSSKAELHTWFKAVITAPAKVFLPQLEKLAERLEKNVEAAGIPNELATVFLKVHDSYPDDIGCFVIFFLNYVKLKPGEALFLAADEPHAYIYGDCVECMACSDNVVRAGLTPKHKDVETLCAMLTYNSVPLSQVRFPAVSTSLETCCFSPPISDFAVNMIKIMPDTNFLLKGIDSASILLVIHGEGKIGNLKVQKGSILFLVAEKAHTIVSTSSMCLYQAFCPV
ncbi:mannose-6-phosphate isomerase [Rhipicephalus sanguineus]|uniref:mannose-6-phosphate isomerase n=1 Tax=Rhipicephalus sanguineus TaxID=34632 RepID=UPI001893EC66|nr:mannose-6-phosphate isomerase [Rhipicephalus sanguineus]